MADGERGKRPVRVTIYNQAYTLLASEEPGLTESLAQRVDELMANIADKIGSSDSTRVAVLASLHLADRINSLEREMEAYRKRVEAINQRCSGLVESSLKDAGDKPLLPGFGK